MAAAEREPRQQRHRAGRGRSRARADAEGQRRPRATNAKNTPRAPVALAITGRRRGSGSRTPRQVLADALQVRSAKKGFSGALLRLVSDVVQGQKLRKGARVWFDRRRRAFAAGELLSAPQKESGRCVVKIDGEERPIQCHASQLCPSDRYGADNECLVEVDDRCLLRTPSSPSPKECVAVTRPNHDGRLVVRVDGGYQGAGNARVGLVHVGQLEVMDEGWWAASSPPPPAREEVKEEEASPWVLSDDPVYSTYYRMLRVGAPGGRRGPEDGARWQRSSADRGHLCTCLRFNCISIQSGTGRLRRALFGNKKGPILPQKKRRSRTVKELPLDYHDNDVEGSIWGDVNQLNGIEVHNKDLEKLFVRTTTPDAKRVVQKRPSPTEQKEVVLARKEDECSHRSGGARLDSLPVEDIRRSVARCDAGAFSKDQLEALRMATPSRDEASRLKSMRATTTKSTPRRSASCAASFSCWDGTPSRRVCDGV